MRDMLRSEPVVSALIGLNILMFLISLIASGGVGLAPSLLRFLSPSQAGLVAAGASGAFPVFGAGHWWTLITANYLHVGALHLLVNMLVLRNLGARVIGTLGPERMLIVFGLGGFFSLLGSSLAGTPLTAGASGALCALIGALIYGEWQTARVRFQDLLRNLAGWIVALMLMGLVLPGVDNWAHVSGLIAGAGIGAVIGRPVSAAAARLIRGLAGLIAGLTLAALVFQLIG